MSRSSGSSLGVLSMIFGIIALIGIVLLPPFVDVIIAIVGLILGLVGKSHLSAAGHSTGTATAGIVMCSIVLVLAIIALLIFGALIATGVGFIFGMLR